MGRSFNYGDAVTPERYERIRQVLASRYTDLTVLMENVNKGHNFSAILRTCDAVGIAEAHAVVPTRSSVRVDRHTARGSGQWVRVRSHGTVQQAAQQLDRDGFQIIAAHPSASSVPLEAVDLTRPTAILVGAELDGVSAAGLALAHATIEVPMRGMVGSLNVSVATAVILYEALRQRTGNHAYRPARISEADQVRLAVEWSYPKLTAICRAKGLPYPELDHEGFLVGEPPATATDDSDSTRQEVV